MTSSDKTQLDQYAFVNPVDRYTQSDFDAQQQDGPGLDKDMSVNVSRDDLQRLVQIIKELPVFGIERDRRAFLATALGESIEAVSASDASEMNGNKKQFRVNT